jgi:hypothetical protein
MKSTIPLLPPLALLALGASLLFSGCAGALEKPTAPGLIAVPSPDGKTGNYTIDNYRDDLNAYQQANSADAVRLRNKMVYSIVAEIDCELSVALRKSVNQRQ